MLALAVAAVLLITCANLGGLLLARAASRGREMAVRTALGATRGRIVRQLPTESLLLGALGAAPGALVASWALRFLQQLVPPGLALFARPGLDGRALAVSVVLSLACGLAFGLAPALQTARRDLTGPLPQGGRGSTGGASRRLRGGLVVVQLGGTLVLVVATGLLGQTLYRLRYADLGLLGALAFTRVLSSLLYGVAAIDPVTFGAAALVLAALALLASYLPAPRALAIDPTAAMRCE